MKTITKTTYSIDIGKVPWWELTIYIVLLLFGILMSIGPILWYYV